MNENHDSEFDQDEDLAHTHSENGSSNTIDASPETSPQRDVNPNREEEYRYVPNLDENPQPDEQFQQAAYEEEELLEEQDEQDDEDEIDQQGDDGASKTSSVLSSQARDTEDESHAADRQEFDLSHIEVDVSSLPCGMLYSEGSDRVGVNAMAGRCNSLGFNTHDIGKAIQAVAKYTTIDSAQWLGKAQTKTNENQNAPELESWIETAMHRIQRSIETPTGIPNQVVQIWPSADAAIDVAILMARSLKGDACYRTIAMVGSDHGRTGMCRSATGIPERQEGLGPMMAGFTHVPMGDDQAFAAAIDEQTACVLISPVNLDDGAIPSNADYLLKVRKICEQHQIALIIDETQLVFGSTGRPSTFQMLADVNADLVIFSAGLFPGISGGLLLGNSRFSESYASNLQDYPLHTSILSETLGNLLDAHPLTPYPDDIHPIAIKIAEAISGFEFIRDINVTGLTIGIETDLDSSLIVDTAKRHGLILRAAGPTAICLQPPLRFNTIEESALIERIGYTMETLEQEFSDPSL
ncbi:MAG: aminotransferase class III-fold pyridoxal phosphate-dependent enzyme [Rubripirellula sp.]